MDETLIFCDHVQMKQDLRGHPIKCNFTLGTILPTSMQANAARYPLRAPAVIWEKMCNYGITACYAYKPYSSLYEALKSA